jgi:hypothetical protein
MTDAGGTHRQGCVKRAKTFHGRAVCFVSGPPSGLTKTCPPRWPSCVDVQEIPYLVVHVFPWWLAVVVLPGLGCCGQWWSVD